MMLTVCNRGTMFLVNIYGVNSKNIQAHDEH